MNSKALKISFTLEKDDLKYFRSLHRRAKKEARDRAPDEILGEVEALIVEVRERPAMPSFLDEAISTLESLIEIVHDKDYAVPKGVSRDIVAALAYFARDNDLIPDNIPALGFLDDAIMIKFAEEELKEELWAYEKFTAFREGAEVRPWSNVARERLPSRLAAQRKKLRAQVSKRKEARKDNRTPMFYLGW
ncbi:MAG: DUF1232 domain-containing protein [Deltaproteobacteria bacterium]|nr:DUF1232 domain-containing protein [Deltaproteobacteria bacterium]